MKKIVTLLFLLICGTLSSQTVSVIDIPTLHQLPVNAIHVAFKDSEGYIWYGTVNGLCRDDGYDIKVFRSDIHTPELLKDNLVGCIAESLTGNIWFGTDKGAYVLNKSTYTIKPLDEMRIGEKRIAAIYTTNNGDMWVSCFGVLYRYNSNGVYLDSFPIISNGKKTYVAGFAENVNKEIYLTMGTKQLFRIDLEQKRMEPLDELQNNNLTEVVYDITRNAFWISSWRSESMLLFTPEAVGEDRFKYYLFPTDNSSHRKNIYDFIIDDVRGDFWLLTESSLINYGIDDENRQFVLKPQKYLPDNCMMAQIMKNGKFLWVTAFDSPSFIVQLEEHIAKNYELPSLKDKIKGKPAIMTVCSEDSARIWFLQERSGLYIYNLKTDEIKGYRDFANLRRVPLNAGREMTKSHVNGGVWLARDTSNDIYGISYKQGQMKMEDAIHLDEQIPYPDFVTKLLEDRRGCLWIGSKRGLFAYDVKQKRLVDSFNDIGHVTGIDEDWNGDMYICTMDKGLYVWRDNRKLDNYPSDLQFSCMSVALDGVVWMGTIGGGVYSYDIENALWKNYNQACGLNGDQINQITVDEYNHVWIGTNQRLIEFNPKNNAIQIYSTLDETILLDRFLPTTMCTTTDGCIYWGGIPGILKVKPSTRLDRSQSLEHTIITDVKVMDKSLFFNGGLDVKQTIRIKPDMNNVEIAFSTLDHRNAPKTRYAYRLIGMDTDWQYTEVGENKVKYSNLDKGTYRFEVKAIDENGLWSKNVTSITLNRLPAFYESTWAYLLYSFLAFLIVSYLLVWYIKRMQRKNNELWQDSAEMVRMKKYLDSKITLPDNDFVELDKVLLDKATHIVEDNISEPDFDVNRLAEAMAMSRSTFTRKIKAITGRVPLDFIRDIKMKHAKRMLEDPDRNITEIATCLGYLNRKYFTSCFKEEFGITPTEYRKTLQDKKIRVLF